jgi:Ser/Thr protein kinase RdoA (MazF antagonist)
LNSQLGQGIVGLEFTPDKIIACALEAGALSSEDVVRRGVLVEQVGRSHSVFRFSVDGEQRFFVKAFGPSRGQTDGQVAREREVLKLARQRPEVAALVAPPWPWNPADLGAGGNTSFIATAAVRGSEAWTLDRTGGGEESVDDAWASLVQAIAPPLAAFHRATRDLARPGCAPSVLQAGEPWGLRLMDGDAAPELWSAPATGTLLTEAAGDPILVAGVRAARSLWSPMALIHGDLKHDNVLVEATEAGHRVHVLDWEMARIGDVSWDLAGLTARFAVARGSGPPWQSMDLDGAALLVRAYTAASGLRVPAIASRLMYYSGVVLLMMALQYGSTSGAESSEARILVNKSRSTFHRIKRLTDEVIAKAEGLEP